MFYSVDVFGCTGRLFILGARRRSHNTVRRERVSVSQRRARHAKRVGVLMSINHVFVTTTTTRAPSVVRPTHVVSLRAFSLAKATLPPTYSGMAQKAATTTAVATADATLKLFTFCRIASATDLSSISWRPVPSTSQTPPCAMFHKPNTPLR